MKFGMVSVLLFSMFAAVPALATAHTLHGQDAHELMDILNHAGLQQHAFDDRVFTRGFDLICEGFNFQDTCFASKEGKDPASSRMDIRGAAAQRFWSLLDKAGFKGGVSNVSDGTAGKWMIFGGNVECVWNLSSTEVTCAFTPSRN